MTNNETIEMVEATEVSGGKAFLSKVGGFIKKHGGKIAIGAAAGAVGLIALVLCKKSVDAGDVMYDSDRIDVIDDLVNVE